MNSTAAPGGVPVPVTAPEAAGAGAEAPTLGGGKRKSRRARKSKKSKR